MVITAKECGVQRRVSRWEEQGGKASLTGRSSFLNTSSPAEELHKVRATPPDPDLRLPPSHGASWLATLPLFQIDRPRTLVTGTRHDRHTTRPMVRK